MYDKHTIEIKHTCIIHVFFSSCRWFCVSVCVCERHYTVVLPSAVLWHLCVAISLLNSCLIIPNLREYSNKADNAFFHMILQSWDSCSAAFNAMFRKGQISLLN